MLPGKLEWVKYTARDFRNNRISSYPGREGAGHGANALGSAVYGGDAGTPISALVVDGIEVHNLQTGSSKSLVLNGNVTHFRGAHNRVHNNNNIGIDIIGFECTAPDPNVDRARDDVVSEDPVYDIMSKGNPAYRCGLLSCERRQPGLPVAVSRDGSRASAQHNGGRIRAVNPEIDKGATVWLE